MFALILLTVPVLPPELAGVLPFVVAMFSNYLRDRQLPLWQNMLIVGSSIIFIAVFAAWLSNGFTSDLRQSVLLVLAFIGLLLYKDASALLDYLHAAPSPLRQKKPVLWQPTTQQPTVFRGNTIPTRPLDRS